MDEAAAETDLAERAEILAEAERMFLRDVPQIPLLYYSSHGLVSPTACRAGRTTSRTSTRPAS